MAEESKKSNEEMAPEQQERRSRMGGMPWMGGLVMILIGMVFLLRQFSGFDLENWWALFIIIPAVGAFGSAWRAYEYADRRFTPAVRGSLIGGLVLTLVAAIFLFNLNWAIFFPIVLILAGVSLLVSARFRS